jgi:hypothetical protein
MQPYAQPTQQQPYYENNTAPYPSTQPYYAPQHPNGNAPGSQYPSQYYAGYPQQQQQQPYYAPPQPYYTDQNQQPFTPPQPPPPPSGPPPPDNNQPQSAGAAAPAGSPSRRRTSMRPKTFDIVAHLHAQGYSDADIAEARMEHAPRTFSMCSDPRVFADNHGGHGMRMYFEFVKYFMVFVFLIAILQIVSFGIAATQSKSSFEHVAGHPFYYGFFIAEYDKDQYNLWITLNALSFVLAFVCAPVYYFYVGCRWQEQEKRAATRADNKGILPQLVDAAPRTDNIVRLHNEGYIDVSANYRTAGDLLVRRLLSAFIFIALIVGQIFVSIALTQQEDTAGNFYISFLVSLAAVVIDFIYNVTATYLTEIEKHKQNSAAIRWLAIKLMLFRVANIMAVYAARRYPTNSDNCVYNVLGEQFLTLWLVEIVIVMPLTIIGTMMWSHRFNWYAYVMGSISGDDSSMPQFLLAREYLKMLYLAFLSFAGMVVFPLSVSLGVFAVILQYWSAKFRLCKLCGRPLTHESSQRAVVIIGLLLASVAGLLTPAAGGAFIMSGYTIQKTNSTCTLP